MISSVIIVFLNLLVTAFGVTQFEEYEISVMMGKCAQYNNITSGQLNSMEALLRNPTMSFLCYMKCVADNDGSLDESGKFKKDNLDTFLKAMKLDAKEEERVRECALNIRPIEKCEDMIAFNGCFPKW